MYAQSPAVITSIYLPLVEKNINEEYIRSAFDKAGIANIDAVAFERNGLYNRVYLNINYWHDTESAYYFIKKLKNPTIETRFVHDNENELWWAVHINKFPHKLENPSKKRRLVLFNFHSFMELSKYEQEQQQDNTYGLQENHAWVDQLLEKIESDKKYRYELTTFYDNRLPFC